MTSDNAPWWCTCDHEVCEGHQLRAVAELREQIEQHERFNSTASIHVRRGDGPWRHVR